MREAKFTRKERSDAITLAYRAADELRRSRPLAAQVVSTALEVHNELLAEVRHATMSSQYLAGLLQKYAVWTRMTEDERAICARLAEVYPPMVEEEPCANTSN
jgi:hypothetical protein